MQLSHISEPLNTVGEEMFDSGSFIQPDDADIFSVVETNPIGECYFRAINGRAFESVASEVVYDQNLGTQWYTTENQLLVIIGSDGGLLIPYLQQRAKGNGRLVIIIELPEMITWIEKNIDYDHDFIRLQPADRSLAFLEKNATYQGYFYRNSLHICRSMASIDMLHPAYARLWEEYERELNRFFYIKTLELHGSAAFINAQLRNIADNRFSIHHLYQQFSGGVGVLLAGGPSLDNAIDWVRQHRDNITLFAVGRVAARLLKEEIYPDFFVSVDPNDISFDNSKQLLAFHDKSVFLHSYHVTPRLASQWRGLSFYHGRRYPWTVKDEDAQKQFSAPGPTVTNTALAFMVQMGFESIVLAGVDLCFRADGQSHESGSLENQIGRFVHNSTQYVKTNGGEMAPTSSDFLTAQVTLQAQVRGIKESLPNVRIINPAPSAAYVEGVAYVPLGELVLPSWKNERYERVQSCIEPLKFDESVFLKHTLKVTQAMRLKLTRTIGHAQKGLAVAKVLFDQSSKIPARTKQLLLAKDKLEKALGDDLPLLMDYAPAKFNDTFLTNTEKKQENSDIQSAFVTYFNAIIESGNLLLTNFDHAIALTQLRQLESSSVTLTQTLVDQWMRFGQPGRLHHWLDRWGRAENELTEAELVIATPALRAYDAIFKVAETGIAKKFKKNVLENTLASVRQAMLVDTEDNITKLDEVLQYCEERAEDDFYRDLGLFILGHFNKLRGDTAQAYQVWGMVEHFKIRQDALKQSLLLSMKVNDYEQSFLALERLCILNRAYLVVYANLLQTMGQVSNAIEVLQTYTKLSPDDIAARLQLVSLLKSEKRLSDAQAELQLAHQLSPTNPVIRRMLSDMGGHLLGEFALDGNFL